MKRWMFLLILVVPLVSAEGPVDAGVLMIKIAAGILVLGSFVVIPLRGRLDDTGKKILFLVLSVPVIIASLYFAGAIIYKNVYSITGGPVHWHADYQVWVCGERLDLMNPKFPRNKIGSPLFHEHDDDRIHVEGTVGELHNVNLGSYFEVIGGKLEDGHLMYPAVDKMHDIRDGEMCDGEAGQLKVFVNGEQVEDYENHLMYPHAYVPPGDCIIIEFSPQNPRTTNKICSSWSAKGWTYENYRRPKVSIGGEEWQ